MMPKKCLYIFIVLLLIVSIFDPEDLILKLKVPLFISIWLLFLLIIIGSNKEARLSIPLFFYLLIFILVLPFISALNFVLTNGYFNYYYGYLSLKPLLFLTLLVILYVEKIEIIVPISVLLTILSCMILCVFFLILIEYDIYSIRFINIAYKNGLIQKVDYRIYGGTKFYYIYFVTAPLLVLPSLYYCYKCFTSFGKSRFYYLLAMLINTTAFFLTGSRNSMLISIIVPFMVIIYCSKDKLRSLFLTGLISVILVCIFHKPITDMFSSDNPSNYGRISLLKDYSEVFNNPEDLLLGQGFGSLFYVTVWGKEAWLSELTYLEIIRRYGLIFGSVCIAMLMYPFIKYKRYYNEPYLIIAYLGYLIMSVTNPFIFSSSGMIMLCVVLYPAFRRSKSIFSTPSKRKGKKREISAEINLKELQQINH